MDRQTKNQKYRHTKALAEKGMDIQGNKRSDEQAGRQTDWQGDWHIYRLIN